MPPVHEKTLHMKRPYNFSAGPSMLPKPVLETIQAELMDYRGLGCSVMELNHRSDAFEEILHGLEARIRRLLKVPEDYAVLFCPGGGRMQFSMVPLNLLGAGVSASYVVTGTWSKGAANEAARFARVHVAYHGNGTKLPDEEMLDIPEDASYVYYCDNETVHGIEFPEPPTAMVGIPVACDMSSNFMSRPFDVSRYGLVWAGTQKNFGIAGLAVVIVRRDLLGLASPEVPTMLNYDTYVRTGNLPNTPPVTQIYVANLMAQWIEKEGGLDVMNTRAIERSSMVYDALDACPHMYATKVDPKARSRMNVTFRLRDEMLTDVFVKEAAEAGFINLAGHRTVGGIRASLYNAMPIEGAAGLSSFIRTFALRHA